MTQMAPQSSGTTAPKKIDNTTVVRIESEWGGANT